MADVLDIENHEEFEVDDDGDRKTHFLIDFDQYKRNNNFQREFCGLRKRRRKRRAVGLELSRRIENQLTMKAFAMRTKKPSRVRKDVSNVCRINQTIDKNCLFCSC